MEQFREDLRRALVQQLAPAYSQLPDLNRETGNGLDSGYRDSVFQFLDALGNAPATQEPAMLLAADFMLQALWVSFRAKGAVRSGSQAVRGSQGYPGLFRTRWRIL